MLLVTLAEATPVLEAAKLQDDLRRAGIEPWAWIINNSIAAGIGLRSVFPALFQSLASLEYGSVNFIVVVLIMLGAAPCTAMVFVWSQLTRGDATYTMAQVALNDVIMIFAFAPLVALLLGVTDIQVPWATLLLSVGLYVLIPLIAGVITRIRLSRNADNPAQTRTAPSATTWNSS